MSQLIGFGSDITSPLCGCEQFHIIQTRIFDANFLLEAVEFCGKSSP